MGFSVSRNEKFTFSLNSAFQTSPTYLRRSDQNNFLNRKTSYYADIVVLDKNGKGGISIIEVKSRKRRAQDDEALLLLDEVFSLNDKVNKAFVVFQDYVFGRTKSKKTWTGLTDGEFHNEFK